MTRTLTTIAQKVIHRLRLYKNRAVLLRRKLIRRPLIFEDGYSFDDNTMVTLYTNQDDLFPDFAPRVKPFDSRKAQTVSVALIAVAKNEEDSAREWFTSIIHQTRLPDEIIVVDTGSSDGTVPLLKQLAATSPVPIRVIEAPGDNISQGRNRAVRSTSLDYIAVTDFGTKPHRDWLELLILPFEINLKTEVSGGWYDAVDQSGKPYRWRRWISLLGKNPQDILSPSVSIAFTRAAWERVGGYPEWLTLTGEDTYFDLELKRTCWYWAFCPDALVDWQAPDSVWAYWKKMYRWSSGDGETGMRASAYWYAALVVALTLLGLTGSLLFILLGAIFHLVVLLIAGSLVLLTVFFRAAITGRKAGYSTSETILVFGILAAQASGFILGASRRREVTRRRLKMATSIYFILAGIPIDDTGGGARSTQISLELLRRQYIVCYLNKYPKSESVDLNLSIHHPNLFTFNAGTFSVTDFATRFNIDFSRYKVGVIVELPHADWLPIIDTLQSHGARVIYELIDEWDSMLGKGWYSKQVELQITQKAVSLTATAPILKSQLEELTHRPVHLLANAVNLRLFNGLKTYPVPADFPRAELVITYIGALYGDWFDWDLLVETAQAYPLANVMVIGDYHGQCPVTLPNLHFLGLKPQSSLPAYLSYTNVTIIPWKVNDITRATSPLKLYEYLAMRVPVVVPDLPHLTNMPSVYPAKDRDEFIRNIKIAAFEPIHEASIDEFLSMNSWETRVTQLIQIFGFDHSNLQA